MIKHQPRGSNQLFVETKLGIVTRFGDWFHITSDQIEEYVPGLLEKVSMETLVEDAQAWVRSADSLSILLLMGLLYLVNPWTAAGSVLLFHLFWYYYKSGFVTLGLTSVFSFINRDGVLLIVPLIVISHFGIMEQYTAVALGLVFFFLFKLGLLRMGWNKLSGMVGSGLSQNDRVLKMIVVKWAIYENVPPPEVQQMEERMKEMAFSKKGK